MVFSRFGGIGGIREINENFRLNINWPFHRNTLIDYRQEVGDLTEASLVMAAVNWVGRTLPEAVFRVYDVQQEQPQPTNRHPLHDLLRRPNAHFSGSTLLKASALSWVMDGNVYWLKARNGAGRVKELWWLPSWCVTPRRENLADYISFYEYRVDGSPYRLEPADVIHFRDGIDPSDDLRGMSALRSLLREIFTDNEYSQYAALLAKNAGVPPFGVVPKAGPGVKVDHRAIKEELVRRTSGDERGKPAVFSSEVEIVKFGFSPKELGLEMQRRVPEERVAAVIGIPAIVLGFGSGLARGTFANYEQAEEHAYETYMVPLWKYMAEELTAQLLPDFDKGAMGESAAREVQADMRQVRALQEDQDALFTRINTAFTSNWILRSEARAMAGLKAEAGRDDVFFADVSMSGMASDDADAADEPNTPSAPRGGQAAKKEVEAKRLVDDVDTGTDDGARGWWEAGAPDDLAGLMDAEGVE